MTASAAVFMTVPVYTCFMHYWYLWPSAWTEYWMSSHAWYKIWNMKTAANNSRCITANQINPPLRDLINLITEAHVNHMKFNFWRNLISHENIFSLESVPISAKARMIYSTISAHDTLMKNWFGKLNFHGCKALVVELNSSNNLTPTLHYKSKYDVWLSASD